MPEITEFNDDSSVEYLLPQKKSYKKHIKIAGIALLLCAIGGGAYWFFSGGGKKVIYENVFGIIQDEYEESEETVIEDGVEKTTKTRKKKEVKVVVVPKPVRDIKKPPVTVPLDVFTVNLKPASSDRYLQASLVLDFSDAADGEAIKPYIPAIRNAMIVLMSNQRADELSTQEGKDKLREELEEAIHKVAPKEKLKNFYGVLFGGLVIQ